MMLDGEAGLAAIGWASIYALGMAAFALELARGRRK